MNKAAVQLNTLEKQLAGRGLQGARIEKNAMYAKAKLELDAASARHAKVRNELVQKVEEVATERERNLGTLGLWVVNGTQKVLTVTK